MGIVTNLNILLEKTILEVVDYKIPKKESGKRGRPIKYTNKEYLEAIFYVLKEGIGWEYLKGFPMSGDAARKKMHQWSKLNVFHLSWEIMVNIYAEFKLDFNDLFIDASHIKNWLGVESVGSNHYDRFRKATKLSILTDDVGVPVGICLDKSNIHDSSLTKPTLESSVIKISTTKFLIGDKGYSSKNLKDILANKYKLELITPRKRKRGRKGKTRGRKPKHHYKLKNRFIVEHTFSWFKNYGRLFRRKDRNINIFKSFVFLGAANITAKKVDHIFNQK